MFANLAIVRGYHFLPNMGGHEKAGGSQNFFMRNKGEVPKNQEIIGWLQILLKILFNEIAPKCIFSALHALGVTCFFNIVAPEGGHKILDHQIGGVTKLLPRYFRKFMTPLFQRKWWPHKILNEFTSLPLLWRHNQYSCMNNDFIGNIILYQIRIQMWITKYG